MKITNTKWDTDGDKECTHRSKQVCAGKPEVYRARMNGGTEEQRLKYIKKPVEVEAIRWTGDNGKEIEAFCGADVMFGTIYEPDPVSAACIHTLNGKMYARPGDYIIKGVNGEYYPCKPDVFAKTYEEVEESTLTEASMATKFVENDTKWLRDIVEWAVAKEGCKVLEVKNNAIIIRNALLDQDFEIAINSIAGQQERRKTYD